MSIIDEYKTRANDIDTFYSVLNFIDSVETYKGKTICDTNTGNTLLLDREAQKCLRAEAIIVLYNAIESTISNCVQLIYDAIHDDELKYFELSQPMRKMWLDFQLTPNMGIEGMRNVSYRIVENLSLSKVSFSQFPNRISGNLDMRQIINICKSLGITLGQIPNSKNTAKILLGIKNKRNDLAHGNKSFSKIGSLLTINELLEYKKGTLFFLEYVIKVFQNYVDDKKYHI